VVGTVEVEEGYDIGPVRIFTSPGRNDLNSEEISKFFIGWLVSFLQGEVGIGDSRILEPGRIISSSFCKPRFSLNKEAKKALAPKNVSLVLLNMKYGDENQAKAMVKYVCITTKQ